MSDLFLIPQERMPRGSECPSGWPRSQGKFIRQVSKRKQKHSLSSLFYAIPALFLQLMLRFVNFSTCHLLWKQDTLNMCLGCGGLVKRCLCRAIGWNRHKLVSRKCSFWSWLRHELFDFKQGTLLLKPGSFLKWDDHISVAYLTRSTEDLTRQCTWKHYAN